MQYRREIDGLRAVAVLPVILFHAGFGAFGGGYVGVDVFFVISGYLITGIIVDELDGGSFSIARFYERRARRILPALFVVLAACIPFAMIWMVPEQLEDFGKSLGTVVLFASNIYFWSEDNYFAAAAELQPLLHTWSLAVEEQYYIFFPLLLMAIWRFGRKTVVCAVLFLAAASFLISELSLRNAASASFYLAPHRAWELLVGSICALVTREARPRQSRLLSALGLGLIVFAVFAYDKETPFPGLAAVVPVLGTALIILFATSQMGVGRLLSSSVLVGIGLISYSAYLWHQPLFAFARLRSFPEPSFVMMASLAVASLVLAWGTWYFVEQPFRKREAPLLPRRRDVFAAGGAAGAILFAVGLVFDLGEGLEGRLDDRATRLYASAAPSAQRERCHFEPQSTFGPEESCVYFGETADVAVYGNSHGVELAYGLAHELNETGRSVIHFTVSGCGPGFGREVPAYCTEFYDSRLDHLLNRQEIGSVVLAFRADGEDASAPAAVVDLANHLDAAGKTVVVVLQAPVLPADISVFLRRSFNSGLSTLPSISRKEWEATNAAMYAEAERLADGIAVVDMADIFCNERDCHAIRDDVALYFDDDHMSVFGASLAAPRIVAHLK